MHNCYFVVKTGQQQPRLSVCNKKQTGGKQTFGDPGVDGHAGGEHHVDRDDVAALTVRWWRLSSPGSSVSSLFFQNVCFVCVGGPSVCFWRGSPGWGLAFRSRALRGRPSDGAIF